jgi:phosphatidylglycerol:prolipoprotein diacylglycerol transferase
MLDFTPNPIAIQLGPIPVYWYGIGYALGLAAAYFVIVSLARRAGEDPDLVGNGMIIVAVAALIGGRLYHVIDQWALYQNDPIKIFLPPYSGLGVYGGIIFGTAAAYLYVRANRQDFLRWADIVAPGLFTMEAIARWGNFFNQELYGPPTTLPWGIPVDCAHRVAAYACPPGSLPTDTLGQFFHPLFLYESISGVLGALTLVWIGFHLRKRLRIGDLILVFFVWYGVVRFFLETLRADNWTFFGVPVAMIVSALIVIPSLVALAWRHRPGHPLDEPATRPRLATWGAIGRPLTSEEIEAIDRQAELDDEDEDDEDEDDDYDDDDEDEDADVEPDVEDEDDDEDDEGADVDGEGDDDTEAVPAIESDREPGAASPSDGSEPAPGDTPG